MSVLAKMFPVDTDLLLEKIMNLLQTLSAQGYDFCKLPVGDGVTDNINIIKQRFDCGLSVPLENGIYLVNGVLHLSGNVGIRGEYYA